MAPVKPSGQAPTAAELREILGSAWPLWDRLLSELAAELDLRDQEWRPLSRQAGWSLRLKRRERIILYLQPGAGRIGVSLVLGDAALAAARAVRLSAGVRRALADAPHYAEGTGIRLEVKSVRDLPGLRGLAALKLQH